MPETGAACVPRPNSAESHARVCAERVNAAYAA